MMDLDLPAVAASALLASAAVAAAVALIQATGNKLSLLRCCNCCSGAPGCCEGLSTVTYKSGEAGFSSGENEV